MEQTTVPIPEFSNPIMDVFNLAIDYCNLNKIEFVGPHHLLIGLSFLENSIAYKILNDLNYNFDKMKSDVKLIDGINNNSNLNNLDIKFNTMSQEVFDGAYIESLNYNEKCIDTGHLLLSFLHKIYFSSYFLLDNQNIKYFQVKQKLNEKSSNRSTNYLPPNNRKFIDHFYKYYSSFSLVYFENLIEKELIKFAQKDDLNDKFDMQIIIDKIIGINQLSDISGNQANDLFKIINDTEDEITTLTVNLINEALNEKLGILCVSEDISNNPMWAHYSENHKGFAIQFDANHEYFYNSINSSSLMPVFYNNITPKIDKFSGVINNLKVWIIWLILNKSTEWAYEKEWRIIKPLTDAIVKQNVKSPDNPIHLLPMPRECVNGIVLGLDFDKTVKTELIDKMQTDIRYQHIEIYETSINRKDRKIQIKPLEI